MLTYTYYPHIQSHSDNHNFHTFYLKKKSFLFLSYNKWQHVEDDANMASLNRRLRVESVRKDLVDVNHDRRGEGERGGLASMENLKGRVVKGGVKRGGRVISKYINFY